MDHNIAAESDEVSYANIAVDPVFVLTAARSGSTLLRFILDSHPALACPPEVGPGMACLGLVRLAKILSADPAAGVSEMLRPGMPIEVPADTAEAARVIVGAYYSDYMRTRRKRRWCDKSLDNFLFAPLLQQVFPEAKYICLYRHCMDVIASGLEACPWGLSGFGFENFAAQFAGNNVAAIGAYWLSCVKGILAFEESNPERCLRVRYEDLVTDSEETVSGIMSFLGEAQVPGITSSCFNTEHDRYGPGDQKIWFTSSIQAGSLGRGVRIPPKAFPPVLLDEINDMLKELGYRLVGSEWNTVSGVADLRDQTDDSPRDDLSSAAAEVLETVASRMVAAASAERLAQIALRWPTIRASQIRIVIEDDGHTPGELFLNLHDNDGQETLSRQSGDRQPGDARALPTIIGSWRTWQALLSRQANMAVELQACRLRCDAVSAPDAICPPEASAVAYLLGLTVIIPPAPHSVYVGADAGA